jgi:hypothetical protein
VSTAVSDGDISARDAFVLMQQMADCDCHLRLLKSPRISGAEHDLLRPARQPVLRPDTRADGMRCGFFPEACKCTFR